MPENTLDKLEIEPIEALTGFIELPSLGRIRLDFLITCESEAIRCLDLGIMSCGESVDECKKNILEAILFISKIFRKSKVFLSRLRRGTGKCSMSGVITLRNRKL